MNEQQLPAFERLVNAFDAFIFKYQLVTSEKERQIRLFSFFPTLLDVNIDGVHDTIRKTNQKLSSRKYRIALEEILTSRSMNLQ